MNSNLSMPSRLLGRRTGVLGAAATLFLAPTVSALAQTAPDAGSLLQQIEQQRRPALPPRAAEPLAALPEPMQALSGPTVEVKRFQFAGNTLLRSEQLAAVVAPFLNRPLGFSELQNAAAATAAAYRKAGWVVRVYLPRQDITDGVVTLQVVEGRFGAARIDGPSRRISADRLQAIIGAAQAPGTPVNGDALDRALLLIEDLPGLSATGRLAEGSGPGETDLVLSPTDGPLFSGQVDADNTGARSVGRARVSGSLALNSPFRLGDQASAILLHSQGSDYARGAYSLPVGSRGLRVGVNASHLSYRVVAPEFEALDARGTSTTAGGDLSYPWLRSRLRNVYVVASFDAKRFDNQTAGVTASHYKLQVASLGLNGNLFDELGGGGANTALLSVVEGRVDLDGSPNQAPDAASGHTAGRFTKLRYGASRQQVLTESISGYASFAGQAASKNLDSSERFYLGGPVGVRAYPASEGGGSEGRLLNLEVRGKLPAGFNATAFYDAGWVRQNKDNGGAAAALRNDYSLQGAGLSVGWAAPFGVIARVTWAHRIGSNPNPTSTGKDQDGTLEKNRFWLQASLPF